MTQKKRLSSLGQQLSETTKHKIDLAIPLYCSQKVSPIPCQTNLRITNHRGHKFPPSETLLSFKTWIKWCPVLTATACFLSVFFQFQQYSRKHSSFSAHKAALTKTELIFPAFSLTFVDFAVNSAFAVSFHSMRSHLSVWGWRDFSWPITIPCHA